ncbi:hypothetical protein [Actinophytocola xinjiangensis]|uniref:hypothetical protein n=1 Tax=Actinophytocola xinjiangensis TaxID=485602 RepID=UPI000AE95546|nr:hypothetical protein [Actinophytocola xinjiangensis]
MPDQPSEDRLTAHRRRRAQRAADRAAFAERRHHGLLAHLAKRAQEARAQEARAQEARAQEARAQETAAGETASLDPDEPAAA